MRRLIAVLAAALAVAAAAPADATSFTFTDPKGDSPVNPGLDIVGVTWATTGTTTVTKVRGRKVTRYVPEKLVATLTLAGAPLDQVGIRYEVEADMMECGLLMFSYAPTESAGVLAISPNTLGCGGEGSNVTGGDTLVLNPKIVMKGNTISWTVKIKDLPKDHGVGATLTRFTAAVDAADPYFGALGPDLVGPPAFDQASSNEDWDIG